MQNFRTCVETNLSLFRTFNWTKKLYYNFFIYLLKLNKLHQLRFCKAQCAMPIKRIPPN